MTSFARQVSLASKVNHCPAISCSQEGKVAISTETGVFVLSIPYNVSQKGDKLDIQLQKIPIASQICEFNVGFDGQKIVGKLAEDDAHRVMLDRTLSPSVQSAQSFRGYRSAVWSPRGADQLGRCVLALLTMDHRLSIYSMATIRNKWTEITELSKLYNDHMNAAKFDPIKDRIQGGSVYQTFKERTYSVAAVGVAWSDIQSDSRGVKYVLLAVIMQNGHLVFWRSDCPVTTESFSLIAVQDGGNVLPSSLCWCGRDAAGASLVAVGFSEGLIQMHRIILEKDGWKLSLLCYPWDIEDRLRVAVLGWCPDQRILIAGKGPYLMVFALEFGENDATLSHMKHLLVSERLSVNSISCTNQMRYFTTANGDVHSLHIKRIPTGIDMNTAKVFLPKDTNYEWKTDGADVTTNGVFLTVVLYPSGPFCHLTLKEPLNISFLQVLSDKEAADLLLNGVGGLENFRDALACIKKNIISNDEPVAPIHQLLMTENLNDLSVRNVKILRLSLRWKLLRMDTKKDQNDKVREELQETAIAAEKVIMRRHIKNVLQLLKSYKSDLSARDKLLLSLMCQWMKHSGSKDDASKAMTLVTSKLGETVQEVMDRCNVCIICDSHSLAAPLDHLVGSCRNGHRISCCCQSLVLTQVPYRVCGTCGVHAVQRSQDGFLGAILTDNCTFCDDSLA